MTEEETNLEVQKGLDSMAPETRQLVQSLLDAAKRQSQSAIEYARAVNYGGNFHREEGAYRLACGETNQAARKVFWQEL